MESAGQLLLSAPPLQLASANMILPNSNNWQKQQEQNPILQQQQHIDRSMDQIIIDVDGSTNSQDEFTITEDASDVKVVAGGGGEQASSADTNVLNQEQRKCPARLTTENQQEKSIKCEQEMDEEMDEAKVGQNPVMVETSGSQSDANQPQNAASIGASGKPLPVIKPPGDEKEDRPSLSYKDLIIEAIESSAECRLKLSEIYQVIKYLHPYYQRRSDQWGWQNSIRHNLSLHDCFVKLPLKQTSANGVVGHFWTVIHRSPEDKQGPTRRRSRANGGGTTGKGKKAMALAQQQHQDQRDAKEGKRGIKGRHTQSVCSDSGFVSDGFDGEFDASQEITMRERLGSASAPPRPRPVLPTASTGDHQKFQSLQSPLALKGLHFLNQQQQQVAPIPQQHVQNNLLSPLELVMNGQPHSLQSPQPQLLPASTHFSPIPGKTAPAILEQLLAMSNFATHQQSQIPNQSHPCTPISAPPTLMPVQPLSTSNSAFVDGGLNLLSQLASHALATASPAQHPHNNNPLAVAAATELQRLQLLQLCAQQQQLQLQQQLALLEQSQREQQQQQQHSFQLTGGHSAPLSPAHEQLQPSSSIIGDNQSGALLTQLLLSRLINASTETGNIQQLHQPQQQQQPNSPPLSMSASQAVVNFPAISLFAHRQQQSELQQAVLLLQQQQQQTILLEQHQQVEVAQLLTSQLAVAAATQQQHQDSTPSSSEPELAVV